MEIEYVVASVTMPTMVCVSSSTTVVSGSFSTKENGEGIRGSLLAEGKVVLETEEPVAALSCDVSGVCPVSCCSSVFSVSSSGGSSAPHPARSDTACQEKGEQFLIIFSIFFHTISSILFVREFVATYIIYYGWIECQIDSISRFSPICFPCIPTEILVFLAET